MSVEVSRHESGGGARIYRIPVEAFPGFGAYAHLVIADDVRALVDVGSGFGDSNRDLAAGLTVVHEEYSEPARWSDLTHILISHGHIDHFGGLHFVRERTQAPIGVHELDYRVLTHYEERLAVVAARLRDYLIEAGVGEDDGAALMRLYMTNKELFSSLPVQFTYEAVGNQIGPLEVIHVPGHCPGQVVVRCHDVLLTADHVLAGISPHQAPERLSLNTGLGHYLDSLRKLEPMLADINLALGGHEGPIEDLGGRIDSIEKLHWQRLQRVMQNLEAPKTIAELARELFPEASGYHELLALEEAGAHVEYLEQRGFLALTNHNELESGSARAISYARGSRAETELEFAFGGHGAATGERIDVRV